MEWRVKYEPLTQMLPWNVYKICGCSSFLKYGFLTEEEAIKYMNDKEKHYASPFEEKISKVDEASIGSFPASDPPGYIDTIARSKNKN